MEDTKTRHKPATESIPDGFFHANARWYVLVATQLQTFQYTNVGKSRIRTLPGLYPPHLPGAIKYLYKTRQLLHDNRRRKLDNSREIPR